MSEGSISQLLKMSLDKALDTRDAMRERRQAAIEAEAKKAEDARKAAAGETAAEEKSKTKKPKGPGKPKVDNSPERLVKMITTALNQSIKEDVTDAVKAQLDNPASTFNTRLYKMDTKLNYLGVGIDDTLQDTKIIRKQVKGIEKSISRISTGGIGGGGIGDFLDFGKNKGKILAGVLSFLRSATPWAIAASTITLSGDTPDNKYLNQDADGRQESRKAAREAALEWNKKKAKEAKLAQIEADIAVREEGIAHHKSLDPKRQKRYEARYTKAVSELESLKQQRQMIAVPEAPSASVPGPKPRRMLKPTKPKSNTFQNMLDGMEKFAPKEQVDGPSPRRMLKPKSNTFQNMLKGMDKFMPQGVDPMPTGSIPPMPPMFAFPQPLAKQTMAAMSPTELAQKYHKRMSHIDNGNGTYLTSQRDQMPGMASVPGPSPRRMLKPKKDTFGDMLRGMDKFKPDPGVDTMTTGSIGLNRPLAMQTTKEKVLSPIEQSQIYHKRMFGGFDNGMGTYLTDQRDQMPGMNGGRFANGYRPGGAWSTPGSYDTSDPTARQGDVDGAGNGRNGPSPEIAKQEARRQATLGRMFNGQSMGARANGGPAGQFSGQAGSFNQVKARRVDLNKQALDPNTFVDPKGNSNVNQDIINNYEKNGKRLPVVIRNNNPGALSIMGDKGGEFAELQAGYVGKTARPANEGGYYAKYATPEHGVAANAKLLEKYGKKGIDTPEAIVRKWSTDSSAWDSYAKKIAKELGIKPGDKIDLSNPEIQAKVLMAKSAHESGTGKPIYTPETFMRGTKREFESGGMTPEKAAVLMQPLDQKKSANTFKPADPMKPLEADTGTGKATVMGANVDVLAQEGIKRGAANLFSGGRKEGEVGANLVEIKSPSGFKFNVHKEAAPAFQGFVNDLEATGYKIYQKNGGGFNPRKKGSGGSWSEHAFGNAIDINPDDNPFTAELKTDLPANVSDMAAKWGITWGGDWKSKKDAMHFEWSGIPFEKIKKAQEDSLAKANGPKQKDDSANILIKKGPVKAQKFTVNTDGKLVPIDEDKPNPTRNMKKGKTGLENNPMFRSMKPKIPQRPEDIERERDLPKTAPEADSLKPKPVDKQTDDRQERYQEAERRRLDDRAARATPNQPRPSSYQHQIMAASLAASNRQSRGQNPAAAKPNSIAGTKNVRSDWDRD